MTSCEIAIAPSAAAIVTGTAACMKIVGAIPAMAPPSTASTSAIAVAFVSHL